LDLFSLADWLQNQQQIASLLPSSASAARLTRTSIFDLSLAFSQGFNNAARVMALKGQPLERSPDR
jgi:hypothetical protein